MSRQAVLCLLPPSMPTKPRRTAPPRVLPLPLVGRGQGWGWLLERGEFHQARRRYFQAHHCSRIAGRGSHWPPMSSFAHDRNLSSSMLAAVDLNDETRTVTGEIDDEPFDANLPSEMRVWRPKVDDASATKVFAQPPLALRAFGARSGDDGNSGTDRFRRAQVLGSSSRSGINVFPITTPTPNPSPQGGGERGDRARVKSNAASQFALCLTTRRGCRRRTAATWCACRCRS